MQKDAISAFRKNLNELYDAITKAKRVPLSGLCMVEQDHVKLMKIYNMLDMVINH